MTRKKVKLAYIANDSARKATFKKRKKGLLKKVSELSTLCGIEACTIIFSPYDAQPEIWPPSPLGVQRVLAQFKKMPEMEQSKKMMTHDGFLRQRIVKAYDQLKKQRKDNREMEMTQVMFQILSGNIACLLGLNSMMDVNDLGWLIDQNLKEISKSMETLKKGARTEQTHHTSSNYAVLPRSNNGDSAHQQVDDQMVTMEAMQKQQWLLDMMNQPEHMGPFAGEEIIHPFAEPNHNNLWSNHFFPGAL